MSNLYEIELWEDEIERDENGKITHHPLNSRYTIDSQKGISYGNLTFAGHDLAKSPLLDDVRVFYLMFYGEPDTESDREAWADFLRIEILQKLSQEKRSWYLSFIGDMPDDSSSTGYIWLDEELQKGLLKSEQLDFTVVQSEMKYDFGKGRFRPRLFFETPNRLLPDVVTRYWPAHHPGEPIEGYNMVSGKIELFQEWDKRSRDDHLFREVMEQTFISFYTFPEEQRHFVFVTNKLTLEDLQELLNFKSLQQKAKEFRFGPNEFDVILGLE